MANQNFHSPLKMEPEPYVLLDDIQFSIRRAQLERLGVTLTANFEGMNDFKPSPIFELTAQCDIQPVEERRSSLSRSPVHAPLYRKSSSIVTFWSDRRKIAQHFSTQGNQEGKQITQYFNYLNFVQLNNACMSIWCLIGWLPHAMNVYGKMQAEGMPMGALGRTGVADILFLSTFQPSSDIYWNAMMCLSTITMFLTGPIYHFVVVRYLKDEPDDGDDNASIIQDNDKTPNYAEYHDQRLRRLYLKLASYSTFAVICGIPAGINYALLFGLNQRGLKQAYEEVAGPYPSSIASPSSGLGVLSPSSLSVVIVVVKTVNDLLFEVIATFLTNMEKHCSWSGHRYHRLFKLVVFRLCNTMSLFIIRYFSDAAFYPCQSGRIAHQVFTLIMLELTLNNLAELGWSFGNILLNLRQKAGASAQRANDLAPDIELTDDYFEVVYRQYIMMAFVSVFPLISLFTLLCNLVEWPLDKFRFVYLSKPKITGSFHKSRRFLTLLFVLSSVAGLVHFPTGPIWFAPPVGPYLCWPCNTFAQMATASGSCLPNFESSQCQDYTGAAIGQDVIQSKITALLTSGNATNTEAEAARAWFQKNDHLFFSRRCGCSPCNLVLSCACDQPPVQRLDTPSNNSAPRSAYSFAAWQRFANTSKSSGCGHPLSPECWTCPEAFNEFVDPVGALRKWQRVHFCPRCVASACICHRGSRECGFRYEEQWQLVA